MSKFYELEGTVYKIDPTQQVTDKFQKREFVVCVMEENNGVSYPQYVKMEVIQKAVETLDYVSVGEKVKVSFVLAGRLWTPKPSESDPNPTEKAFTTIKAIHVQAVREAVHDPAQTSAQTIENVQAEVSSSISDEIDDLPF